MHPLSGLSTWHRAVGLALILVATIYIVDLTVLPIEFKSQSIRDSPFLLRDESICSDDRISSRNPEDLLKAGNFPKEQSSAIAHVAADDTRGLPVQELVRYPETKFAPVEGSEELKSLHIPNSTWKPEIGQWLAKCGEAAPILVPEQFANRVCEGSCRGRGVCNHELGTCRCHHGYAGNGCELEEKLVCFDNETEEWLNLFGLWRVSKCGASCDTTRSFCFCGEGSKYPYRPVAEQCGFTWKDEKIVWDEPDASIFSNSGESIGWCNLSVQDLTDIAGVEKCGCKYDGAVGRLCEIPVESFCINQCSGNGRCHGGSCACVEGWHGIDCSIPSSLSSLKSWPNWLMPGVIKTTDVSESGQQQTLEAVVERRRPLIYVYELPARFNSHLLEGRHWKYHCATRLYDENNATIWIDNLYGSEVAILETLLSSVHRTDNAEEADFFYVPVLGACAIQRADEAPHMKLKKDASEENFKWSRMYFSGELYREAYQYIRDAYPYWNQSEGRDHIWLFPWDEGACAAPKEIWNSMMLVHWGNTNYKYSSSTSAYLYDRWNEIPTEWRGNHPCYDPEKDLVIPAWKLPVSALLSTRLWARTREERSTLFYFNGNLGADYWGRVEPEYSMGLRQKLAREFSSEPNKHSTSGKQSAADVVVTYKRSEFYGDELSRSRFCGVLPGDGWSGRMEDSILHGCIPVIIQDGIHLPFENVLNYDEFALRVAEDDLPQLISILRNVSDSRVDSMLSAIKELRQRFAYISTFHLEAKREKQKRNGAAPDADWIQRYTEISQEKSDDAFATIIQVLHFRLYKRTWTRNATDVETASYSRKDYCSKTFPY